MYFVNWFLRTKIALRKIYEKTLTFPKPNKLLIIHHYSMTYFICLLSEGWGGAAAGIFRNPPSSHRFAMHLEKLLEELNARYYSQIDFPGGAPTR